MGWNKIEEAPENGHVVIGMRCRMVDGKLYTCCADGSLVPWDRRKDAAPAHFFPVEELSTEIWGE